VVVIDSTPIPRCVTEDAVLGNDGVAAPVHIDATTAPVSVGTTGNGTVGSNNVVLNNGLSIMDVDTASIFRFPAGDDEAIYGGSDVSADRDHMP